MVSSSNSPSYDSPDVESEILERLKNEIISNVETSPDLVIKQLHDLISEAQLRQLPLVVAECKLILGKALIQKGLYDEAYLAYIESYDLFKKSGDLNRNPLILNSLASLCRVRGELEESRRYIEEAISVSKQIGDTKGLCIAEGNLAVFLFDSHQFEEALTKFKVCIEQLEAMNDQAGAFYFREQYIKTVALLHRNEEAIQLAEELIEQLRACGMRRFEGHATSILGLIYMHQTNWSLAAQSLEAALVIHREVGDPRSEAITLNNLGNVYVQLGKLAQAVTCYEESLQIHTSMSATHSISVTQTNLALIAIKNEEYDSAYQHLTAALEGYRNAMNPTSQGAVELLIGWVFLLQGDFNQTLFWYEHAWSHLEQDHCVEYRVHAIAQMLELHAIRGDQASLNHWYQEFLLANQLKSRESTQIKSVLLEAEIWYNFGIAQPNKRLLEWLSEPVVEQNRSFRELYHELIELLEKNQTSIPLEASIRFQFMRDTLIAAGIPDTETPLPQIWS